MKYNFNTSVVKIKQIQALFIDIIRNDNHWCLKDLLNVVGFFQGKGVPCLLSQRRLGEMFGVTHFCVNRTVALLNKLGIVVIKKRRYAGSRWLHNEMYLSKIMFTKDMVEGLLDILSYHHFKKYFSLSSVNLIELKLSQIKNFVTKPLVNVAERLQTEIKAAKWDELLSSTSQLPASILSV